MEWLSVTDIGAPRGWAEASRGQVETTQNFYTYCRLLDTARIAFDIKPASNFVTSVIDDTTASGDGLRSPSIESKIN